MRFSAWGDAFGHGRPDRRVLQAYGLYGTAEADALTQIVKKIGLDLREEVGTRCHQSPNHGSSLPA
jgi:hypothetical protein